MSNEKKGKRRRGRPRLEDRPAGQPTTRERIIEAASDLFGERGFALATMSAIAQRADLTTGALYVHFEGKAELLVAVVEAALRELPTTRVLAAPQAGEADPAFLPQMASEYAYPKLRSLRRLAIEVHLAAMRDKRAADLVSASSREAIDAVRSILDRTLGTAADSSAKDRDYSARLLLVVVMGLAHLDTLDPDLIGDDQWIRFLEESVARMLGLPAADDRRGSR